MSLQILPKESALRADVSARQVIEHLQSAQVRLCLQNAVVFYNFPLFREEEKLLVAELVIASPIHGVMLISTALNGIAPRDKVTDTTMGSNSGVRPTAKATANKKDSNQGL